ncbi:hypothetical protein Taro_004575 [Colocasia esculenta]|uniref:Uncharacterized protein n=1 Tax=Colocasia esculenta TaxID=4460 RepID=A0A843TVC2_COLES|nr:hypothetical protein [Colocasia esculenta]
MTSPLPDLRLHRLEDPVVLYATFRSAGRSSVMIPPRGDVVISTLFRGELDGEIYAVRFFRATLRLDDWRVGGPQPVSRDVECDSVLCVLLVVVLSRLPWSPFSIVFVCGFRGCGALSLRCWSCLAAVSGFGLPVGYWYFGSWVVTVGDVVFGRWLCRHLSRRLEMPRHDSRLGLNHRTSVSYFALWRSGTLKRFQEGVELLRWLGPVWPVVPFWLVVLLCVAWLWNKAVRLVSVVQQRYSGAGGWFSCWRLKKSTSRDVDVDLFREEVGYKRHDPLPPSLGKRPTCDRLLFLDVWSVAVYLLLAAVDAAVYCLLGDIATLRLDDWRVGGPQPVSRDVECDSVLCVLLVVVLSRLPWSPFSIVFVCGFRGCGALSLRCWSCLAAVSGFGLPVGYWYFGSWVVTPILLLIHLEVQAALKGKFVADPDPFGNPNQGVRIESTRDLGGRISPAPSRACSVTTPGITVPKADAENFEAVQRKFFRRYKDRVGSVLSITDLMAEKMKADEDFVHFADRWRLMAEKLKDALSESEQVKMITANATPQFRHILAMNKLTTMEELYERARYIQTQLKDSPIVAMFEPKARVVKKPVGTSASGPVTEGVISNEQGHSHLSSLITTNHLNDRNSKPSSGRKIISHNTNNSNLNNRNTNLPLRSINRSIHLTNSTSRCTYFAKGEAAMAP